MHTRIAIIRSAGLVLLAALAACTGGSPGSPSLGASGTAPVASSPGPAVTASLPAPTTTPPTPSPEATGTVAAESPAIALPGEPPIALLGGLAGGPAAGDLGTVSWAGGTSDGPWVVGRSGARAATGTRLTVAFDPAIRPMSWQARWAPVEGLEAGSSRDGGSGAAEGQIAVDTPMTTGDWSLQVVAQFDPDSSGAWYWRIEVSP